MQQCISIPVSRIVLTSSIDSLSISVYVLIKLRNGLMHFFARAEWSELWVASPNAICCRATYQTPLWQILCCAMLIIRRIHSLMCADIPFVFLYFFLCALISRLRRIFTRRRLRRPPRLSSTHSIIMSLPKRFHSAPRRILSPKTF